ncbi:MAG: EAL domain-containing protein [Actinobacteria bacterium]|nr:EAL domain-containing protein [Actinomycetota bacterium]
MRSGRLFASVRRLLPTGAPLTDRAWRRRHRGMTAVLGVHVVLLLALPVAVVVSGTIATNDAPWDRPLPWAFVHSGYVTVVALTSLIAWRYNEDERRRTERVLSATGEAIYGINDDGLVTFANPAMAQLLRRSIGDLIDRHHHDVLGHADADGNPHERDACPVCADVARADGRRRQDQLFVRAAGALFPVEYASHPVRARSPGDGLAIVVNFRDISERRAFERELNRQALHDRLTGLPNRTLLLDRVGLALADLRNHPYMTAVVFCNVNRFKRINDSFGHDVGDLLLGQLASRLRAAVRSDETVARIGADEFVVCCPTVPNEATALAIAERLRGAFATPFDLDGTTVHIDLSIGVACTADPDMSSTLLISQADQAMTAARLAGVGVLPYEQTMVDDADEEVLLEEELRVASRAGQLELYYQPTVELATDRIVGFEALMRWNHPEHGLVAPCTFVPLAERSGLIVPMGRWALREACRQIVEWNRGRATPLTVGVNVSARQLQQPGFADDVVTTLQAARCRPECLLLEITESVLIAEIDTAAPALARLRELGVHIALDDFGTGYSSLTYLRQLPVDSLKIDRSFVTDLGTRPDQRSLIAAVVNMARSMSMHTIAEGVELKDERDALLHVGCDRAQGFYYARPLPRDEAGRLLVDTALFTTRRTARPSPAAGIGQPWAGGGLALALEHAEPSASTNLRIHFREDIPEKDRHDHADGCRSAVHLRGR